jgi:hypothetical protein
MKGIGPFAIAIIAIIALLGITGGLMNVALYRVESMSFSLKDIYVVSEINKVESFKVGLPYMAQYSFCYSLYKVSENGGCFEEEKQKCEYWRKGDWTFFPSYKENIAKLTNITANEYLKSYFGTKEETYTKSEIRERASKAEISLTSDKLIEIAPSVVEIKFNVNPSVTTSYPTYMSSMYGCGKKWFVSGNIINDAAESAFNALAKECKVYKINEICENEVNQEAESHNCEGTFKNNALKAVNELSGSSTTSCDKTIAVIYPSPLYLDIKIKDSSFSHSFTYTYESKEEDSKDCDCKQYDDQGNCIRHYDKLINVKIKYTYSSSIDASITIADQHNYCPLFGKYDFPKLKFSVLASGSFSGEGGEEGEEAKEKYICENCVQYPDGSIICDCHPVS